jgi:hypothetical protein
VSAIFLMDALSLWTKGATAPRETIAENDGSEATALDGVIRALHAQVPAEGTRSMTGEELAAALMVAPDQRAALLTAFLGAEVKSNGSAHVRLSSKVRFAVGDTTVVLGPDLHAKISADRFETRTGFAIKVGFTTPRVRSVARGEEGGQRGVHVQTTLGSRFLPFG